MKVLGLVPAQGGSEGIPRKNARFLAGRPPLAYTADATGKARRLSRVILSTEEPEIAEIGRRCGLEVPFLRPAELARDETPMLPVVQHALRLLEERGDRFDAVCSLQPASPFRSPEDIDACIAMLEDKSADAVVAVLPIPLEYNPHWVYFQCEDGCIHLSTGEFAPIGAAAGSVARLPPRRIDLRDASRYCAGAEQSVRPSPPRLSARRLSVRQPRHPGGLEQGGGLH